MKNVGREDIASALKEELDRTAPEQVGAVCREVLRRHEGAVVGLLFYGSCLRKQRPDEGVIDVYALVRGYRATYRSRILAWSNAWLAPNVFYVEVPCGDAVVRAKYAVISMNDFARAALPESLHAIIWGRFCQPALLAWADTESVRAEIAKVAADAVMTMVVRTTALLVDYNGQGTIASEELWQRGFRETYKTELRAERSDTIASIYRAAPERYDRILNLALQVLQAEGALSVETKTERVYDVRMRSDLRRRLVRGWRIRRPTAKAVYVVRLIKSAFTFGDWLPYALWKLNRHTGVSVELTERQRRYPLIFGWSVILRLVRQRSLR
jgi:hypothetical protein